MTCPVSKFMRKRWETFPLKDNKPDLAEWQGAGLILAGLFALVTNKK
jgi:hypothetical protein